MKILIENSGYALENMGDVAMLQSAVQRIREILPASELHIVTTSADRLQKFCPDCHALDAADFACWRSRKVLPFSYRLAGSKAKEQFRKLDAQVRWQFPSLAVELMRTSAFMAKDDFSGLNAFWRAIKTSDAVVATGGGYFTDSFPFHAEGILDTLHLAQQSGKPTALFGQGVGPLTDVHIKEKLEIILKRVAIIGLREKRKGPRFLEALGVDSDRVVVTGDDAIELARKNAPPSMGGAIGFNLRVASYSGVSNDWLEFFKKNLRTLAADLGAAVVAIPIETKREDSDVVALQGIIPEEIGERKEVSLNEPLEIIQQIARCRVVITGSYHAGVFALSMGIPVIGLVKSEYYADKFFGLQRQFETGVLVVQLENPNAPPALAELAKKMWAEAPGLRDGLLQAADQQVAEGRRAFQEFFGRFK